MLYFGRLLKGSKKSYLTKFLGHNTHCGSASSPKSLQTSKLHRTGVSVFKDAWAWLPSPKANHITHYTRPNITFRTSHKTKSFSWPLEATYCEVGVKLITWPHLGGIKAWRATGSLPTRGFSVSISATLPMGEAIFSWAQTHEGSGKPSHQSV